MAQNVETYDFKSWLENGYTFESNVNRETLVTFTDGTKLYPEEGVFTKNGLEAKRLNGRFAYNGVFTTRGTEFTAQYENGNSDRPKKRCISILNVKKGDRIRITIQFNATSKFNTLFVASEKNAEGKELKAFIDGNEKTIEYAVTKDGNFDFYISNSTTYLYIRKVMIITGNPITIQEEEKYDFADWFVKDKFLSDITSETEKTATNSSGQQVYIETASFIGHPLNGRIGCTTASFKANKGLGTSHSPGKARTLSIMNLKKDDLITVTMYKDNKYTVNYSQKDVNGETTSAVNGEHTASFLMETDGSLDLKVSFSSDFIIKQLTIKPKHLKDSYYLADWSNKGTFKSDITVKSKKTTVNSSGDSVYVETATFAGYPLNGRFACTTPTLQHKEGLGTYHLYDKDGDGNANDDARNRTLSIMNLNKGDTVYVEMYNNNSDANTVAYSQSDIYGNTNIQIKKDASATFVMKDHGSLDFKMSIKQYFIIKKLIIKSSYVNIQPSVAHSYDFYEWSKDKNSSFTSAITAESEKTAMTMNSTENNLYVETSSYFGHSLDGRFACSTASFVDSNGLGTSNTPNKRRTLSIQKLKKDDIVTCIFYLNSDGSSTITATSENDLAIPVSGKTDVSQTFLISRDGSLDLSLNVSKIVSLKKMSISKPGLINVSSLGVTTFSNNEMDIDLNTEVTGLKAYWAKEFHYDSETKSGELVLQEISDGIVPKGKGVVIEGVPGTYKVYRGVATETCDGNLLRALVDGEELNPTANDGATIKYVLSKKDNTTGFYRFQSPRYNLGGKAALVITYPTVDDASESKIKLRYDSYGDNETNAIEDTYNLSGNSGNNYIYDFMGRKVENPKNGLYIYNGKKILIK